MKRVLFIVWTLKLAVASGQTRSVSGTVKDKETGHAISFCGLRCLNGQQGVITDVNGNFKIAEIDSAAWIISSLGYMQDTLRFGDPSQHYVIFLRPDEKKLQEVVVTGVSKATAIRENPVAIISISPKLIQRTQESNIIDVLVKNAAGLSAVKTGPNISKPFIRGLGYNRVLTLYDDVRQEGQQWGDEHGIEVDAYNIEKAEVIKGPASLMYGSDALAGVVSLIPYIPRDRDSIVKGKVYSEYQSNNGLIGEGVRIGYSNGKWLWSLRGSFRLAKNYTNAVDGRVYNTSFRENNASILLGYENEKGFTRLNFTWYENLQGIPDGSRDSMSRRFTKQVDEINSDSIKRRPIVSDAELNSYELSPLHQDIQHVRFYSNTYRSIGTGDLNLLFALQQNTRKEFNHPTDVSRAGMSVCLQTMNYGIRYNAPRVFNIETSFGLNGMYQLNKNRSGTTFPIPDYDLFDAGLYLFSKWKYSGLTISGGIRYDSRSIKGKELYIKTDSVKGFDQQVYLPDTTGARLQFPSFAGSFGGISASLGIAYSVNRKFSLKANVARGYRAPNISEIASNGLDPGAHIVYIGNKNFLPEFSFQQDIGAIFESRNISSSLSVFNNFMQNYIYLEQVVDAQGNPLVVVPGNKTFQYQQASAQLYGTEFSLDIHPVGIKGFSFTNNLAFLYGYNTKTVYHQKGINGEYLPFIPPPKFLSCVSQEININSKIIQSLRIRAEIDHSAAQNRYMALYQTETLTPSYSLFNAGFEAVFKYSKKNILTLFFSANNLFNTVYQSNLSRLKYFEYYNSSPSGSYGIYGMGRNYCVKLILDF